MYTAHQLNQPIPTYIKLSSFLAVYLMGALWFSFCLYLSHHHVMSVTITTVFVRLLHPCLVSS